jgi:hypothetical protein
MTACARCRRRLDPVLTGAGFRTHPCCWPGEVSALWPPETAGDPEALPVAIDNSDNRSVTV